MSLPGYSEHHTGLELDCDFFKNGYWAGKYDENNKEEIDYIHSIIH